jgi:hypothetical protein
MVTRLFRHCRKLRDKCPLISPEACSWASRLLIQFHDGGKAETRQAGCRAAAIDRPASMIGAASHAWIVTAHCPCARLAGSADWCCGAFPPSFSPKSGVRGIIHAGIWTHELAGAKIGAKVGDQQPASHIFFSGMTEVTKTGLRHPIRTRQYQLSALGSRRRGSRFDLKSSSSALSILMGYLLNLTAEESRCPAPEYVSAFPSKLRQPVAKACFLPLLQPYGIS